ncbi:DUF397 domain-containing protein [Spirillospora sp. CA-253888]
MDLSNTSWRKSTHSGANGGECIEIAASPQTVAVRDSKNPDGPKLLVSCDDFQRFAKAIKIL